MIPNLSYSRNNKITDKISESPTQKMGIVKLAGDDKKSSVLGSICLPGGASQQPSTRQQPSTPPVSQRRLHMSQDDRLMHTGHQSAAGKRSTTRKNNHKVSKHNNNHKVSKHNNNHKVSKHKTIKYNLALSKVCT